MKGAQELQKNNNTVMQIDLTEHSNDVLTSTGRPVTLT